MQSKGIDRDYEDVLSGELTICERMAQELEVRRNAIRRARLRVRLGVASDIVRVELRQTCPELLIEARCWACERPLILCGCP